MKKKNTTRGQDIHIVQDNKNNKTKNNKLKVFGFLLTYYVVLFLIFYFSLFALSGYSAFFYIYIFLILAPIMYIVIKQILDKKYLDKTYTVKCINFKKIHLKLDGKKTYVTQFIVAGLVVVLIFLGITRFAGSTLFNAKKLSHQLPIIEGTTEEFEEVFSYDKSEVKLPIIDKDLAFRLAEQTLGNYGAQYTVNYDNFTITSVIEDGEEKLYRVTPLEYSGFFVSINKMSTGSVGYIKVNVETQEAELIEVEGGIKYLPSAILNYDLNRKVRFSYPTKLFGKYSFEIDDSGNPYWVIPTYRNECALFAGANSTGTIVLDAVTGESNYYEIGEEPRFVDRVCDTDLVDKQATNALKYQNGFFNATVGAKSNVFATSDGYNYFIRDGHTYYVSCITSVNNNDQTSIGFVTIDLKTKEAKKYLIPGITEMRARDILMLDESVKAQALDATWPILINYRGVPTYFVTLKNNVQFQLACLINVSDGSVVAMGNTLDEAAKKYESLLAEKGEGDIEEFEIVGTVTKLLFRESAQEIDFIIDSLNNEYFVVRIDLSLAARFLKVGDKVKLTYQKSQSYNYVLKIELL